MQTSEDSSYMRRVLLGGLVTNGRYARLSMMNACFDE